MELEEVWKDIENYPNYQISNLGRVKSKERYTKQRNGMNLRKEKLLTPQKDHKGYLYVRLYNENGWKYFKIHRLVADAFIPNVNNKPTIDHINRKKDDNNVHNLRWADYIEQQNNKDKTKSIENMRIIGKKPYKNRAKKVKQYDLENNFIKEWISSREASHALKISETAISNCVNGISKKAGRYIWKR